jgi:hypothetical protein
MLAGKQIALNQKQVTGAAHLRKAGPAWLSFWRRRVQAYTDDLLAEVLTLQ